MNSQSTHLHFPSQSTDTPLPTHPPLSPPPPHPPPAPPACSPFPWLGREVEADLYFEAVAVDPRGGALGDIGVEDGGVEGHGGGDVDNGARPQHRTCAPAVRPHHQVRVAVVVHVDTPAQRVSEGGEGAGQVRSRDALGVGGAQAGGRAPEHVDDPRPLVGRPHRQV